MKERDNSGILGKNERKTQENHPGYSGKCMIGGKLYWISGWVKDGARGKFFSLAFKPRDAMAPKAETNSDASDYEVPF